MKKTLLVVLVIASVVFSAFAGGLHYGIESDVGYSFNISDEHPGSNSATFAFKPYAYNDNFTIRLLAEWRPDDNGANGFEYLFDFDTTDVYTIIDSALKYVDEIGLHSDVFDLVVGKGTRTFEINYDGQDRDYVNRAQLNIDFDTVKVDAFTTEFVNFGKRYPIGGLYPDDYNSVQYIDVMVNLGLVSVEAAAMRQGYYGEFTTDAFVGKNRIIPKVGARLHFGLTNVGFFFTTDMAYDPADDSIRIRLLDRWVLEALAEFKVGTFDMTGKFYLDNRLQGYGNLAFQEALFGLRADANLKLGDFFSLKISGDLPLKLDGALRVVKIGDKTMESLKASVELGSWWKIGGEIAFRGLISQIDNGNDALTILKKAEPTVTFGIYTVPLDITASAKLTTQYDSDIIPEVTVSAVIRADNALGNINK